MGRVAKGIWAIDIVQAHVSGDKQITIFSYRGGQQNDPYVVSLSLPVKFKIFSTTFSRGVELLCVSATNQYS